MAEITPSMQSALSASVLTPVLIIRLDIEDDPLYYWSGPGIFMPTNTGDAALDGVVFENFGDISNVSDAVEDNQSGAPMTITAVAANLDQPLLRQVVRDRRRWWGKRAYVWLGLLAENEVTVVPNPVRLKSEVIADLSLSDEGNLSTIALTVDGDRGATSGRELLVKNHSQLYPGDEFGNYIQALVNSPEGVSGLHDRGVGGGAYGNLPDYAGRLLF